MFRNFCQLLPCMCCDHLSYQWNNIIVLSPVLITHSHWRGLNHFKYIWGWCLQLWLVPQWSRETGTLSWWIVAQQTESGGESKCCNKCRACSKCPAWFKWWPITCLEVSEAKCVCCWACVTSWFDRPWSTCSVTSLTLCLTPSQRLRRHLPTMTGHLWIDWFWVHPSSCKVVGLLWAGCWPLHMSSWCSSVQIQIALCLSCVVVMHVSWHV